MASAKRCSYQLPTLPPVWQDGWHHTEPPYPIRPRRHPFSSPTAPNPRPSLALVSSSHSPLPVKSRGLAGLVNEANTTHGDDGGSIGGSEIGPQAQRLAFWKRILECLKDQTSKASYEASRGAGVPPSPGSGSGVGAHPQTATPPGSPSGVRGLGLTENQHTLRMERALAAALMVS